MNRSFLLQNIIYMVLVNSGNVLSYVFQLAAGRGLTPSEYGTFNALNSLAALIFLLASSLPVVLAKFAVKASLDGPDHVKGLLVFSLKRLVVVGMLILVAFLGATPLFKDYLHLDSSTPLFILAMVIALSCLFPATKGIMQGLQRFFSLGVEGFSFAFMRLALIFPLVFWLGWGVNGALLCSLGGTVIGLLVGAFFIKDVLFVPLTRPRPELTRDIYRFIPPAMCMALGTGWLGTLDIVLVKHYCLADEAGFYATASILGRIPLYLSGVLVTVLFPEAAKAHAHGRRGGGILLMSLGLTALTAGVFATLCVIWPTPIVTTLYGAEYAPAGPLLAITASAMAFLALVNVLFSYALAQSAYGFLWFLGLGVAGLLSSVTLAHEHPIQIAWAIFWVTLGILVSTGTWLVIRSLRGVSGPGHDKTATHPQGDRT